GLTPGPSPVERGAKRLLCFCRVRTCRRSHDLTGVRPKKTEGSDQEQKERDDRPLFLVLPTRRTPGCGSVLMSLALALALATRTHDSLHDRKTRCRREGFSVLGGLEEVGAGRELRKVQLQQAVQGHPAAGHFLSDRIEHAV